jgi:hypothetical protein
VKKNLLLTIKWVEINQNADIMRDFDEQVFENIFNDNKDDGDVSIPTIKMISGQRKVLIFNLIGSQYNAEGFQKGLNLKQTIPVWNFPELVSATKYRNDCIGSEFLNLKQTILVWNFP